MDDKEEFMARDAAARRISSLRRSAAERFEQDAPDDVTLASFISRNIRSRAKTYGSTLRGFISAHKL